MKINHPCQILKRFGYFLSFGVLLFLFSFESFAAPGDLDPTFGSGGLVINQFSPISAFYSVTVQPDGKIIAAGTSSGYLLIVRYNNNGTLDGSFGNDGTILTDITHAASEVVVQQDGKIVIGGYFHYDFAVVRFNADGSPDQSFGSGGRFVLDLDVQDASGALAVQPNGKIVVAGMSCGATNAPLTCDISLFRLNPNGTLDKSFGSGGWVLYGNSDWADYAHSIAIQEDGRILVGGACGPYYSGAVHPQFAILRFLDTGSLDLSFGAGGVIINGGLGYDSKVNSILLQADGKIVAVGETSNPFGSFQLARYNPDGSSDASFGNAGYVVTQGGIAASGIIQSNGKIVAAGRISNGFGVVRHNPDGSLDQSFGIGGKVKTVVSGVSSHLLQAVALQSDGKIVGSGWTQTSIYSNPAVVRYLSISEATITGRVFAESGNPLRNATVTLTSSSETQQARTNSFGYFSFANIPAYQTVTISVKSKLYLFDAQTVDVNGDLAGIDFYGRSTRRNQAASR